MPQTSNHGYNVPNKGDPNWHKPLNNNFRQYDTDIEIRDLEANRSNYQPKQGAKFFATDTGAIYLGNGSAWQRLLPSGEDPVLGEVRADRLGLGRAPIAKNRLTARLSSGDGAAVDARTSSSDNTATGVYAEASSSSGNTFGTYSVSRSPGGHGVFGVNFADNGNSIGVEGRAQSPDGIGVQALNRDGLALKAIGNSRVQGNLEVTEQLQANMGRVNDVLVSNGPIHIARPVDSENEFRFITDDNGTGLTRVVHRYLDQFDSYEIELLEETGDQVVKYTAFTASRDGSRRVTLGADERLVIEDRTVTIDGDLDVTGQKNFTQPVETDDGQKEVVYTATEAPTPRTETSGVAELDDGCAVIELPDHFGWVTDDEEPLVVETTPYSVDSGGLAVVERSTDRLVIEDMDGEGDYEFSYTVRGTREGYADTEVVREPTAHGQDTPSEASADD